MLLVGCAGHHSAPAAGGNTSGLGTPPPSASPDARGTCNAQPAQFAVGQASTASVMESARARSGAEMARVLRPGQMVTKEFNAQRLNLQVDAQGRVVAVHCG